MTSLPEILSALRAATGADREIDEAIFEFSHGRKRHKSTFEQYEPSEAIPAYTASLDAITALIERELPGWAWKVGTCCVSDDAWVVPDFNSPIHGERLKKQFPNVTSGSIWDEGIDIDLRPSGKPALALCIALVEAMIAMEANSPDRAGGGTI